MLTIIVFCQNKLNPPILKTNFICLLVQMVIISVLFIHSLFIKNNR